MNYLKLAVITAVIITINILGSIITPGMSAADDAYEMNLIKLNMQIKEQKEQEKKRIMDEEIAVKVKEKLAEMEAEINYLNWCDYNTSYAVDGSICCSTILGTTDLKNRRDITTDQMNYIIDKFLNGRESKFKNTGEYFIQASKQTGYDPIFLLCLAAQESGWCVSNLHSSKNNPYSINMKDSNPHAGYVMGDTFNDGIINGAIWISDHYYNRNKTSLEGMKGYCSTHESWKRDILSMMNKSYKYLEEV